ncbi:hypothetical protein LHJ74_30445 [Streptomyces sp. N2-109]|uniref:Uncharacterized protein n=1 Tax=Streptomyces gossypii TaxID=2883101 RepID=A0ABT2K1Y5_9ACTN|nr:hypothetical protein [Streptomyces gossypii]MCT2594179.1 hypothetical protein [Streptomyces gossypii]
MDDPSWNVDGLPGISARTLTANDLTFHYFKSDVVIGDGSSEIQLRTPGLPVVDFVLMLVQLYREVMLSGESIVESSQSQDSISAVRRDGVVEVSYSFSGVISTIPLCEFKETPRRTLRSALEVLYSAHEDLRSNDYLISLTELVRSD